MDPDGDSGCTPRSTRLTFATGAGWPSGGREDGLPVAVWDSLLGFVPGFRPWQMIWTRHRRISGDRTAIGVSAAVRGRRRVRIDHYGWVAACSARRKGRLAMSAGHSRFGGLHSRPSTSTPQTSPARQVAGSNYGSLRTVVSRSWRRAFARRVDHQGSSRRRRCRAGIGHIALAGGQRCLDSSTRPSPRFVGG